LTKEKTEPEPKAREGCIYRVFTPLFIIASGQCIPGSRANPVIADLSDVSDEMIHWLLERDGIETADGEPINKPTGAVDRPPCPCSKRS
jgi:hypothetical protein